MKKTELLENILWLIEAELDQALEMSNKRRKEFREKILLNPPSDNSVGKLKEAPGKTANIMPPGDATPPDAAPDMGAPQALPSPAGGATDPAAAMGDAGAAPLGAPGSDPGGMDPGGAGGGLPGEDEMGVGDEMGGGGAGGGVGALSGGFGGGGGGGGGLGDLAGEGGEGGEGGEPAGEAGPEPSYNPFKDAASLEDRLQVILDTAQDLATKTQDPQRILKHVKGLIQNGFEKPEQAARVIADLFNTTDPVLQQVSKRLALFTTGA